MSLSVSNILNMIAPQFSSDSDKSNFIILATNQTSDTCFGENKNYAIALRTAHMMTIRDMEKDGVTGIMGGVSGVITGKREGDLSLSFGNASSGSTKGTTNEDLILTKYGKQLLGLIKGQIPTFAISGQERINC